MYCLIQELLKKLNKQINKNTKSSTIKINELKKSPHLQAKKITKIIIKRKHKILYK